MNFVAHYFLDRHRRESDFAIGVATPDLMSIYNAGLRVKYHHVYGIEDSVKNGEHGTFFNGVIRHFEVDRIFHSSEFFFQETRWFSSKLAEALHQETIPRKFFVSHVLLELILDKVLIREHPGILDEYYNHFDNADNKVIRLATESVTGHSLPNYENFLRKFRENEYLFHYTEWNHILFVLKRILRRVNIEDDRFTNSPDLVHVLEEFEQRLALAYHGVFGEIVSQSA